MCKEGLAERNISFFSRKNTVLKIRCGLSATLKPLFNHVRCMLQNRYEILRVVMVTPSEQLTEAFSRQSYLGWIETTCPSSLQ